MVAVLLVLDGASEPLGAGPTGLEDAPPQAAGAGPTSLERARTPALDALGRDGTLGRLRTVPCGLPVGSECALPGLLGWTPTAPVDRGALEAAAAGVEVMPGERAWRVDVLAPGGGREGVPAGPVAARLGPRLPAHRVIPLAWHRLLVVGPPPLPPLAGLVPGAESPIGPGPAGAPPAVLYTWPEGEIPPPLLDYGTVLVGASGAAVGAARLLGARTVTPLGATGGVDTDLGAKAATARQAISGGVERVVVHVGAPDEAAHARDPAAKVASIERIDSELVTPLAAAVGAARGTLRVCPDHGCDPATGEHDGAPVPLLDWPGPGPHGRFTERAVAGLPVQELEGSLGQVDQPRSSFPGRVSPTTRGR